jgi:hypothetical protein
MNPLMNRQKFLEELKKYDGFVDFFVKNNKIIIFINKDEINFVDLIQFIFPIIFKKADEFKKVNKTKFRMSVILIGLIIKDISNKKFTELLISNNATLKVISEDCAGKICSKYAIYSDDWEATAKSVLKHLSSYIEIIRLCEYRPEATPKIMNDLIGKKYSIDFVKASYEKKKQEVVLDYLTDRYSRCIVKS